MRRELEDVVELIQHIQSRLPVNEAACTSVLSKSWLHAWSTIPLLRLYACACDEDEQSGKSMELVDVERTLQRYLCENIPIERFDLMIDIENQDTASNADNWIRSVATKTCLKELSLSIHLWGSSSFMLPCEILSGENLTKISVSSSWKHPVSITTTVIKCLSLRELHLDGVRISEEALHHIFSSCILLVKIELLNSCEGFKKFKVKNLHRLYELRISLGIAEYFTHLEISDVPNLSVFSYDGLPPSDPLPFNAPSTSLGSSLTQLELSASLVTDNACLDMIGSGFPFLESLTLNDMTYWMLESFHFKCASIKILSLDSCLCTLMDVQVHAPKLLFFTVNGHALPSLLFPVSTLNQIMISLELDHPLDAYFFLRMREALKLSRECYLNIKCYHYNQPRDIDIDDLRTRLLLPPAMNVQELLFQTVHDTCLWKRSPFFEAFFEICHPKHVYACPDYPYIENNHFCRLMLREVLEKTTTTLYWTQYLKHVQIRQTRHQNWKSLTDSHTSFLNGSALDPDDEFYVQFKLTWGLLTSPRNLGYLF